MQTVLRSQYLDVLKVLKDKNLIKVATGVRRCGKSTLMSQFQDLLRAENPEVAIIDINIDMPDFRFLAEKSWKDVYDFIVTHLTKDVTNYVFIDEVQNVKEFEKLLEGLYVHPNIDFALSREFDCVIDQMAEYFSNMCCIGHHHSRHLVRHIDVEFQFFFQNHQAKTLKQLAQHFSNRYGR
ncbi:MAG: hypothetical protein RI977_1394, partial [Bacteroidota bacterium]